jgi:two-component system chemotaxis sensor kinase CheA
MVMESEPEFDLEAVMDVFVEEARDILADLGESLLALEAGGADMERLRDMRRGAHTLKGNAVSLDLPGFTQASHVLEDALEGLVERHQPVTGELITRMLRVVDVLSALVETVRGGARELAPAQLATVEALAALLRGEAPPAAPVAPEPAESAEPAEPAARTHSLRVEAEKLDRLLDLVGEITIARGRLTQFLAERAGDSALAQEALDVQREADRLYLELQERVMKARMVPVGPFFRPFLRTVRELALGCGKLARLRIEGGEVEVDTAVLERLREALLHMLRNAVDHGIESPEERRAKGKDPCGQLVLRAFHDAGGFQVELSDDGGGIRRDKLREKARRFMEAPERLEDEALLRLVFEPGLSTAEAVTDLSGRGVGMDVVRRNVEALRGTVGLESEEGRGTTVRLRLPLTLAIIEGFLVGGAGEVYVLPMEAVEECLELPGAERGQDGVHGVLNLRGAAVPYLRLRHLFGLKGPRAARENVVVLSQSGRRTGLVVDALLGEAQTVIKPLGRLFRALPCISGSTLLGNGRVALVLDVAALLREAHAREAARPAA